MNEFLLGEIESTFSPDTIFGWYRDLVGRKYNSVGPGQKKRGRPSITIEVVEKILGGVFNPFSIFCLAMFLIFPFVKTAG